MEFYIITRSGIFIPSEFTGNQCKEVGHKSYNYHIKMVFLREEVDLNKEGYVVDHAEIGDLIHYLHLSGSCEEMHLKIHEALKNFFELKGIEFHGYRCTIQPDAYLGHASIEYVFLQDNIDSTVLSLLN